MIHLLLYFVFFILVAICIIAAAIKMRIAIEGVVAFICLIISALIIFALWLYAGRATIEEVKYMMKIVKVCLSFVCGCILSYLIRVYALKFKITLK